jgi:HEAT repeat protein
MRRQSKSDECLRTIVRDLGNPDSNIHWKAAESFHSASAVLQAAIVDTLRRALCGKRRDTRVKAAWGLGLINHATAVPDLLNALGDPDSEVRSTAISALEMIGEPATAPVLAKLVVEDPDSSIRVAASYALGKFKSAEAAAILIEVVLNGPGGGIVLARVADALGNMKDPAAVPALLAALRQPNPTIVRRRAALALGWMRDPQAVLDLVEVLADPDPEVVIDVAYALGEIKAPEAVPGLVKALRDPRIGARYGATCALGSIKDPAAVPELLAAVKTEKDEEVRQEICRALVEIIAPAEALVEQVVRGLAELADSDPSEAVQITAILALEDAKPGGGWLSRRLVKRSDLAVAPRKQQSRRPKREKAEALKSRLALLQTCLAWRGDTVSERAVHKSLLLKTERMRLGLPERVSAGTVHYHLKSLARMCKVDRLWDLADNYQFSTFRTGVKERLDHIRTYLEEEIREEEKRAEAQGTVRAEQSSPPKPHVIA